VADVLENVAELMRAETRIGILAEDLSRIFEEFYRADNARAMMLRGNGVRLSIVKRIVESYGGKIRVESEKNGLFFSAQLLDQGSLINRYS